MENSVSSRELTEWLAYYELEPFGHVVDQHMIAQLSAIVINANRGKDGKKARASDFMPKVERKIESDERSIFAAFRSWATQWGRSQR